jgi:hypothetical protein
VQRKDISLGSDRVGESPYDTYAAAVEWVSPAPEVETPPERSSLPRKRRPEGP